MPTTYSYPGVYVEEVPSGVRPITGVSTSDTAFVGYFGRGPVDEAVRVTSFGDFERQFGGLNAESEASYAIQQYYRNGGSVAWVVRVLAAGAQTADSTLVGGSPEQDTLTVQALSGGAWGNAVQVAVDRATPDPDTQFNLAVRLVEQRNGRQVVVATESFRNLTMSQGDPRNAVDVVNADSTLVRLADEGLGEVPAATGSDVIGNPQDSDFHNLGTDGGQAGSNGNTPSSNAWITAEGATALVGSEGQHTGLYALEDIAPHVFNILCIPGAARLEAADARTVYSDAATYCGRKRAFLILDIPDTVDRVPEMTQWMADNATLRNDNAAVYFPRVEIGDALAGNRPRNVGASGTMAGIYARTDATRGVWKAPAGTEAALRGAAVAVRLADAQNGALNPQGVNALRNFPIFGDVAWGARTTNGADQQASEWKYVPVRRTALFIEESLYQGLKWVVFEPNSEDLWSQVRLNVGAFMQRLFRQGAFKGTTPREAYFVKCDAETTTNADINVGVVNILVGFAPLKPAEFVVIKIQQMAGQTQT